MTDEPAPLTPPGGDPLFAPPSYPPVPTVSSPGAPAGPYVTHPQSAPPAPTQVPRDIRPFSTDGRLVVLAAIIVGAFAAYDVHHLGAVKHRICAKWLAKGQADCAGGDGFREYGPAVVVQGLTLLVVEFVVVPFLVYAVARLWRARGSADEGAHPSPGDGVGLAG